MEAPAANVRALVMALFAAMIAIICAWLVLRMHGGAAPRAAVGLATVLPVALPLPALWRGSRPAMALSTMIVSVYIGLGAMELVANPGARWLSAGLMLAAFAAFAALVLYLRVTRPAPGQENHARRAM